MPEQLSPIHQTIALHTRDSNPPPLVMGREVARYWPEFFLRLYSAQRFFWARAIRLRAAADSLRRVRGAASSLVLALAAFCPSCFRISLIDCWIEASCAWYPTNAA